MLIGHFTEQPWQDDNSGLMGTQSTDLSISNEHYNPSVGSHLYNRYLDEKVYAEEMGFDALMLNEHHSTPFCMQGVTNVGASILARITNKAKIIILGNVLPIWDDPLWLAEQLAMIDMISNGRLVSGFVRGGGRESYSHNAPPHFNRERFEEAHDFLIKAWTTPGPWRWEGKHYHYRYVNPLGAALAAASPAHLDSVHRQRRDGQVDRREGLPAGAAGHQAGADQGGFPALPRHRRRVRPQVRDAKRRLPVEGARRRDRGEGRRGGPQVLVRRQQPLLIGQRRAGEPGHYEPAGTYLPQLAAAVRHRLWPNRTLRR